MPDSFKIEIEGIEELQKALDAFPAKVGQYLSAAGKEAASRIIFPTVGVKKYPPATAANQPPTPYYIRGKGAQRAGRRKPEYNDMKSERYGTQWYAKRSGYGTEIGNRASYAPYLAGDEQASAMARIGWRKLVDVVTEKMSEITEVYQAWVNKLLRDIGL